MNEITVIAGILLNEKNQVFCAKRPSHALQGDYWEFPGGKVEAQETLWEALKRELQEEIGIEVLNAKPFAQQDYSYPERLVKLHVWLIEKYSGEPKGLEGQLTRWVELTKLYQLSFPPANQNIIRDLLRAAVPAQ